MATFRFPQFFQGKQTSDRIMMGFNSEAEARKAAEEDGTFTLGEASHLDKSPLVKYKDCSLCPGECKGH
jgi:hypothetical protein